MYSGFDPNSIDTDAALQAADETAQYIEDEENERALREQQVNQLMSEEEQAKAAQKDPRNKEGGGGFKGVVKEFQSAIGGGLQDTASSLVTLPERAIDMFSGEMVEEGKTEEGYGAEWDDWFVDDANPIETKTWWGSALRSLTHFGTMAAAIIPAASAAGVGAATTVVGGLVRGAAIGALSDLGSKYSQEDNGLAVLRDRFNFIDTPLSTKDTDHPAMKTLKNVVEGMGIGAVFDGASILLGKGVRKVRPGKKGQTIVEDGVADEVAKAETRATSVKSQKIEKAKEQLQTPVYGAYKNEPISDPWQAAPTSNGKPFDVKQQLSRTRKEWGAEMGSTDSLTTPVQLERTAMSSGMAEDHLKEVMGEFMTDARVQAEIAAAKKAGRSLKDVWGESIETAQQIFEGRNTSDLTPDEFWAELNKGKTVLGKGTPDEMEIISSSNVVAADLVIGSLMREMRDMGVAGRELFDIADVADIDGPAKAMYDKIIAGLTQVKLSKMTQSAEFASLGAGKTRKKAIHEAVDAQVQESIDGFRLALKVAGNDPDDGLFRAIFETISMTNEIQNLTDFDNWIRKKLKGGEFNGKAKTGLLIKELQGVMIHSVLSGPKTSVRAIMGTGSATFLRPLSTALGATLSGDAATKRSSLAAMNAIMESIPEAWTLFKTKLNSYWSGDIAQVNSRFAEYTKGDEQWAMFGDWIENSGRANLGDKAAYYLANMARSMNDNKFLTYSTKIMAATDDTFGYLLSRAKGRERAMREAMTLLNKGEVTEITPQLLKEAEDRFLGEILDADGNITDAATLFAKKEATLTTDLTGFAKGLNDVFEAHPWSKPFFLFARTGVNGLALTAKHTPGLNFIIKEFNDIAQASPNNLQNVLKYGIETAEELANAKALQKGRLAIGSGVITMASTAFMSGNLTGNGPTDRKQRQLWIDAGYQPRSIKIGGVWVNYDSFEPFNLILSTIADVGDHSQLMGEEWTEKQFLKTAVVMAQGVSSKSYLAGMQQFVDLFAGQPGQAERIVAGLLNNQIPLSSLRNELGKLFNPHMKELNAGISDAIRNRNLITEHLAVDEVPTKYDMLNGRPIRDWDFPTRMFNAISPFSINLDQGPGRKLLFDSKYDLRLSTYSSPDGVDLSKSANVRSLYQKAIGDQNLELKLDKLATDPKILNSIAEMQADLAAGRREMDPMKAYFHNKKIKLLFDKARKQAWANIKHLPEVQELIEQKLELDLQNIRSLNETTRVQQELEPVLNLYK
tara:strand:- start:5100 stop:8834 length:3735 start_codon:yes stop_codon:yes gene_type:complete